MNTIQHLGISMYSTLPPVIGEVVANAWDADASLDHYGKTQIIILQL